EFMLNGEPYERFSEHVGKFPCVIVAPDDVEIIAGGSELRRRFMDALISQIDYEYLRALIGYNKVLQQRNSYLKSVSEDRSTDLSLLDVYDDQMVKAGYILYEKRKFYLGQALPSASYFYQQISNDKASMELVYESQLLNGSFKEQLRSQRERDIYLQRTLTGIHRDNIEIRLDGEPFRYLASQGQRKSLLFALKLAEFMLLKKAKGFSPILLLDDVFEKLDADRMHNLLHWVCVENDGQIFITDTHGERIRQKLDELGLPFQLIEL
ncbi:MAG: DNA replication/repair protein RecF, partial [Chitinophagales bacterium]